MIPQHLSLTQEHFSPQNVVEAARLVMGGIDLDPASCLEANARHVHAEHWIGLPDDGLAVDWRGRVWLNPPGGTFTPKRKKKTDPKIPITPEDAAHKLRYGTDSRACAWWFKLVEEHQSGRVPQAVFLGFTLELMRTAQSRRPAPLDFSFCVPSERLCFGGDQPTHANVIVSLGNDPALFEEVFSEIGQVRL